MPDYTEMTHEELAYEGNKLSRIINRDTAILGYMPTDAQVDAAEIEYAALNTAARARNEWDPHRVGAFGPEAGRLAAEEVAMLIAKRMGIE
jgi:hypothetical protein